MEVSNQKKEDIYREYHSKVFRYIQTKISNRDTAEDIVSDVFVKVYEKIDSFDETKASLSTWIYTITRNTIIDYFRTFRTTEELPETMQDNGSIEEDVCRSEQLEILASGLETLEERERDIIILRYYKGMRLTEIADQLGISYAYVKFLQKKAFSGLKIFL